MELKLLRWIGRSKNDLKEFPEEVQGNMGSALLTVQWGDKPENAKPLKGFGGAKVLEEMDLVKARLKIAEEISKLKKKVRQ
jgi:phage-related protein